MHGKEFMAMARAVELPMPTPTRELPEGAPERERPLVPDTVLKALVAELEQTVTRREQAPERRAAPAAQERARYNHD
jgi:hypothetical protein